VLTETSLVKRGSAILFRRVPKSSNLAHRTKASFTIIDGEHMKRQARGQKPSGIALKLPKHLQHINLDAAGINGVRAAILWRCPRGIVSVREFGSFTGDLEPLADWLKHCGVKTVYIRKRTQALGFDLVNSCPQPRKTHQKKTKT
jgi:hypothetical protein